MQNRSTPALALWGIGYLFGATAAALSGDARFHSQFMVGLRRQRVVVRRLWHDVGRRQKLRRPAHPYPLAGGWRGDLDRRLSVRGLRGIRCKRASAWCRPSRATYALLAARELWYARDRELLSRWPTLALVVLHAGFLLARIPFARYVDLFGRQRSAARCRRHVMAFEALFTAFLPAVPARRHVEGTGRTGAAAERR